MKINGASIIKSLIIITVLFIVFVFGAYFIKSLIYSNLKESLTLKSSDSLVLELNNNLPLSDKLAIVNDKDSISGEVFKNIEFDVVNNSSNSINYELYITKKELVENEINGQHIKMYLTKENGENLNGFNKDNIPNYDNLNVISDMPGSRILYRGTVKANSVEEFEFKTWIADSYVNFEKNEKFIYSIRVRVI